MTPEELLKATVARRAAEERAQEDLPVVQKLRARVRELEAALAARGAKAKGAKHV